jgi:cysteine synthase A
MSIFEQMEKEPHPVPAWVVMSAGTGGTSATIGRYIRYRRLDSRLCVADPSNSVYYEHYRDPSRMPVSDKSSNIEGIGRPRVEPSFQPSVIDRMIKVDDAAAIASIHFLEGLLDRKCGGSTGSNFYAACQIASEMHAENFQGSIVLLICDSGDRYLDTYYDHSWLRKQGFDTDPYIRKLEAFYEKGILDP